MDVFSNMLTFLFSRENVISNVAYCTTLLLNFKIGPCYTFNATFSLPGLRFVSTRPLRLFDWIRRSRGRSKICLPVNKLLVGNVVDLRAVGVTGFPSK